MQFFCPRCGRDEEVIGDRNPRCRFCRAEMIPPSDYSEWWISPCFAIDRMQKISETYGIHRARSDGKFKKEREAWTTAMLALTLSKLTAEEWWIEIETVDNTPDTRLRRLNQTPSGNIIETHEIEVVDWEGNVDDIMEVIRKKCARAYPGNYLLLVNARHSGKLLDFDRVIDEMKMLRSPFLEVWIVTFIGPGDIKVVRVAPGQPFVDLTRGDFERAQIQKPFLKRGTRGTTTEFKDLGLAYLPIPRVD
jgi:hypothetical protein